MVGEAFTIYLFILYLRFFLQLISKDLPLEDLQVSMAPAFILSAELPVSIFNSEITCQEPKMLLRLQHFKVEENLLKCRSNFHHHLIHRSSSLSLVDITTLIIQV